VRAVKHLDHNLRYCLDAITVIVCFFFLFFLVCISAHPGDQQSSFYTYPRDKGSVRLIVLKRALSRQITSANHHQVT